MLFKIDRLCSDLWMCLPPHDWMSGIPPPPSTHFSGLIRTPQVHGRSCRFFRGSSCTCFLPSPSHAWPRFTWFTESSLGIEKTLATRPTPPAFRSRIHRFRPAFFTKCAHTLRRHFFYQNKGFDLKTWWKWVFRRRKSKRRKQSINSKIRDELHCEVLNR